MITKICTQCSKPFEAQYDDMEHPQTKCLICCPMCQIHGIPMTRLAPWPAFKCEQCAKEEASKVVGGTDEEQGELIECEYETESPETTEAYERGRQDALKHSTGEVVVWESRHRRIVAGGDCCPPLRYQIKGPCAPWKDCPPDDYHNKFGEWLAEQVTSGKLIPKRDV